MTTHPPEGWKLGVRLVFADGHSHTNPVKGLGIKNIAKRFKQVNGWFIALVSLPPHHYDLDETLEGYKKSFDILINECRVAREEGLRVACFAGIHPAEIDRMVSQNPKHSEKVIEFAEQVLNYIAKLVKDGLINGIGEIGRPHYKAAPESFVVSEIVLRRALEVARDLQCPVHLHLEQGGFVTAKSIADAISLLQLNREKVILHHVDVLTAVYAQSLGLLFTVPGKLPILSEVFKRLKPVYMIESDFIDDPKRPGVSSYPWQIVENQLKLLSEGMVSEEYLYKINVDVISRVYGVTPP